jgi:hypothetical protein
MIKTRAWNNTDILLVCMDASAPGFRHGIFSGSCKSTPGLRIANSRAGVRILGLARSNIILV